MSCAIFNDKFQLFMEESNVIMRMSLSSHKIPKSFRQYYGGAMQNPDLKRVELAAMLRDAEREQIGRNTQNKFKSYLSASRMACANSNE